MIAKGPQYDIGGAIQQGVEQGRIRAYQDQMMRQGRCAIYDGQIVCQ
jgi:hypothetical protein